MRGQPVRTRVDPRLPVVAPPDEPHCLFDIIGDLEDVQVVLVDVVELLEHHGAHPVD